MLPAILAAVASVVVVLITTLVPLRSAKHQREVASLEADLLAKLPEGSEARDQLLLQISTRVRQWGWSPSGSPLRRVAAMMFGATTANAMAALAFALIVRPPDSERMARSAATLLPITVVATAVTALATLVLVGITVMREAKGRRKSHDSVTKPAETQAEGEKTTASPG